MFSGSVVITDLDDFLVPAQDCVVELLQTNKKEEDDPDRVKAMQDEILKGDKPDLIKESKDGAKVSLYDCLACSGCVTTSDVVLMEMHGVQVLENYLKNTHAQGVFLTICLTSLVAVAHKFALDSDATALYLIQKAFEHRTAFVASLAATDAILLKERAKTRSGGISISSHCPGVVCFVEKSASDLIPHMDLMPSSMMLMGSHLKQVMTKRTTPPRFFSPSPVFKSRYMDHMKSIISPTSYKHVTIASCYDKKLEAVRPEFSNPFYKYVDLVLGVNEFVAFLEADERFNEQVAKYQSKRSTPTVYERVLNNNGELEEIEFLKPFRDIEDLSYGGGFGVAGYKERKVEPAVNKDMRLITGDGDESPSLLAYGVRNINNVHQMVQKKNLDKMLKRNVKDIYIEAMACPSACIMGGAHAPLIPEGTHSSEFKAELVKLYKRKGFVSVNEHPVFAMSTKAITSILENTNKLILHDIQSAEFKVSDLKW